MFRSKSSSGSMIASAKRTRYVVLDKGVVLLKKMQIDNVQILVDGDTMSVNFALEEKAGVVTANQLLLVYKAYIDKNVTLLDINAKDNSVLVKGQCQEVARFISSLRNPGLGRETIAQLCRDSTLKKMEIFFQSFDICVPVSVSRSYKSFP